MEVVQPELTELERPADLQVKFAKVLEEEIIHAMHPHPTYSEAVMEAAGQGLGASVHI